MEDNKLDILAEANEFEEINPEDLNAVSGGCGTSSKEQGYTCYFCNNNYQGEAPHILQENGSEYPVCNVCYREYSVSRSFKY